MGWKLLVGFVILLALGTVALAVYGSRVARPDPAMPDSMPGAPAPPRPRVGNTSQVVVGDLGTLEGPIAGTLDDQSGLGYEAWQGSDRATIIAMLQSVP